MPHLFLPTGQKVLFSEEDRSLVEGIKWYAHQATYGLYARNRAAGYMHRVITSAAKGLHVDHINGKCLDNRRSNLRVIRPTHNNLNRGGWGEVSFKGVTKEKGGRFRAGITPPEGKRMPLGMFDSAEAAAKAYDKAALELFGEFAWLNFPRFFEADDVPF